MKLLKLTFEQSRKVVDSRKDMFADDNTEKRNLTLWNRLVGIAATGAFIIMVMALGLGPAETAVDSHGDYLISMDTALASQLVSMYIYTPLLWLVKALGIYMVIYLLMPFPNILVQRVLGLPFFFLFYLVILLAILPLTLGCALGNNGSIVTIIWSLMIIAAFIIGLVDYYRDKMTKATGKALKEIKFPKIISFKNFVLVSYAISFIQKAAMAGRGHLNIVGILIGGIYPLAGGLFVLLIPFVLDMFLSWYYIAKYPTQYRVYYQIPDSVWYYSERRAAKHQPVYPRPEGRKKDDKKE